MYIAQSCYYKNNNTYFSCACSSTVRVGLGVTVVWLSSESADFHQMPIIILFQLTPRSRFRDDDDDDDDDDDYHEYWCCSY